MTYTHMYIYIYIGGLSLHITYTPNYPDELPEFEIDVIEGDISSTQLKKMMEDLRTAVNRIELK